MRGLLGKLYFCSLSLLLVMSGASQASVDPFQKSKSYNFGADIPWYAHQGAALKSGSVRDGADTNYYHLTINKNRLQLRLGRNDPSGDLDNTRQLASLAIADVRVDGRRLPVFNWCLQNQRYPGKKLRQNAAVPDNVCLNVGGGGDFIIRLSAGTRDILKKSATLEFVVEPYGRPVKLRYSMSGFSPIMAKFDKSRRAKPLKKIAKKPIPVSRPAPEVKKLVVVKAKPESKPKLVAVKKPRPGAKAVKMCNAPPPADFKLLIKPVAYPCANTAKKLSAEKKVLGLVNKEKTLQKQREARQADEHERLKAVAQDKRNADWDNKQAALWIPRCQRHWKKGTSPCYCDKYLKNAPRGTKSTCRK